MSDVRFADKEESYEFPNFEIVEKSSSVPLVREKFSIALSLTT